MNADILLPVGRVAGRRGTSGEMTVRVGDGDASWWDGVRRVTVGKTEGAAALFEVEASRSYRDRLVLKLRGIDDAGAAESLRGQTVWVRRDEAPEQPEGRWYVTELVGFDVEDERSGKVGTVGDVMRTAASDLLVVQPVEGDEEILVPLAEEIVLDVDAERRKVRVRLPEGLIELNRRGNVES